MSGEYINRDRQKSESEREAEDRFRKKGYPIPYSIEEAKIRFDLGKIIADFYTWVVTDYGLECLTQYYVIPKHRLHEADWKQHICEKSWSVCSDFSRALDTARRYHNRQSSKNGHRQKLTKAKRYRVMRRDGFTCQLCGATPKDDRVRLELDHKHPVSRGGSNDDSNLWTLCNPCNRGKGAQSL